MTSKQLCNCGSLTARLDRLGATKEHSMFAAIFQIGDGIGVCIGPHSCARHRPSRYVDVCLVKAGLLGTFLLTLATTPAPPQTPLCLFHSGRCSTRSAFALCGLKRIRSEIFSDRATSWAAGATGLSAHEGSPRSIVTIAATLRDRHHRKPSRRGRLDRSASRQRRVRNIASR